MHDDLPWEENPGPARILLLIVAAMAILWAGIALGIGIYLAAWQVIP